MYFAETDPIKKQNIRNDIIEFNRGAVYRRVQETGVDPQYFDDIMQDLFIHLIRSIDRLETIPVNCNSWVSSRIFYGILKYKNAYKGVVHVPLNLQSYGSDKNFLKGTYEYGTLEFYIKEAYTEPVCVKDIEDSLFADDDIEMSVMRKYCSEDLYHYLKERLSTRYITILYYYYIKKYDIKKIAKIMKLTRARVYQMHTYALQRLRHPLIAYTKYKGLFEDYLNLF
jgi:RNA polymerase sigma factor (sigma-70 family)